MGANDFRERIITVPFRGMQAVPAHERADRSMILIHEHLAKHFKVDAENVRLDTQINENIWTHGRQSLPNKFRVRVARFDEGDEPAAEAEPAE